MGGGRGMMEEGCKEGKKREKKDRGGRMIDEVCREDEWKWRRTEEGCKEGKKKVG